ncbi:MAG TPA: DinB family protein [Vicinamibacterales bacterium]|jgi:uncharacterized damage-inducible protein DinB
MDADELRELLTHMEWADAHTWRSIHHTNGANEDERLRYLLHHIHLVQSVYLQTWRSDPLVVTELSSYADLAAIESWARLFYPAAAAVTQTIDESQLNRPLDFPWSAMIAERYGTIAPATMSESVWQVLSHTTYHRGQVATRIRELGGEPPLVDFLVWVWSGKPAPQWE